nr:hypothetical protein [Planctomycetota bacterium]
GAHIECEDSARLRVRLASGTVAEIACDNDLVTDWHARIRIEAERGAVTLGDGGALIEFEHPSAVLRSELAALDGIRSESVRLPGKSEYGDHHALQIADCIGAILAGRPPAVTIADAAPSIRTVLAAYHSAALGGDEVALGAAGYRHPVITASAATAAQGAP